MSAQMFATPIKRFRGSAFRKAHGLHRGASSIATSTAIDKCDDDFDMLNKTVRMFALRLGFVRLLALNFS
jgi:hypothetical protein